MRYQSTTMKIPRSVTELNGALYIHVEYDDRGEAMGVRFSHKGKDDSTLDRILTALGDGVTELLER